MWPRVSAIPADDIEPLATSNIEGRQWTSFRTCPWMFALHRSIIRSSRRNRSSRRKLGLGTSVISGRFNKLCGFSDSVGTFPPASTLKPSPAGAVHATVCPPRSSQITIREDQHILMATILKIPQSLFDDSQPSEDATILGLQCGQKEAVSQRLLK